MVRVERTGPPDVNGHPQGVRRRVRCRWKALGELFRSRRVSFEVVGAPKELCFNKAFTLALCALLCAVRAAQLCCARTHSPGACLEPSGDRHSRGSRAPACCHAFSHPSLSAPTALCSAPTAGIASPACHCRILNESAPARIEHQPPVARHGARCLTGHLRLAAALICPNTRLYSLHMRGHE